MLVRQIDSTPIGDYFHDCGISKAFSKLKDNVDEFEVESDNLTMYCDMIIECAKGLKSQIKKLENEYQKHLTQSKMADMIYNPNT